VVFVVATPFGEVARPRRLALTDVQTAIFVSKPFNTVEKVLAIFPILWCSAVKGASR